MKDSLNYYVDQSQKKLSASIEKAQSEIRMILDELPQKFEVQRTKKATEKSAIEARAKIKQLFDEAFQKNKVALEQSAKSIHTETTGSEHTKAFNEKATSEQPPLQVGQLVKVPKWKTTGVLLELNANSAKVALGSIQMKLSPNEIEALKSNSTTEHNKS